MATPDFVLRLREKVGHEHLWLSGVTVFIFRRDFSEALFVQRSDTQRWTPVTGIIDPGEEPASAAVREAKEETDLDIRLLHLAKVGANGPMTYPNGDEASYLDLTFSAEWVSGEAWPADGENLQACWYSVDKPPELSRRFSQDFAVVRQQLASGELRTVF